MIVRITAVLLPVLCAVCVLLGLPVLPPAAAEEDELLACSGVNHLANPSFEGNYPVYVMDAPGHPDCQTFAVNEPNQYCERARLAVGWHPFWRSAPRPQPWINIMPEFTPSYTWDLPSRVRSGEHGQHYFSFYSSHEGGVYQQVTAVPGGQYCFSAWGHAWSANTSLPDYTSSPDHGYLFQKIGIDPTGGTDWQSPAIVWGEARMQYDEFGLFRVEAEALGDTITVFLHSRPDWPVKHNDVYWDDAALSVNNELIVTAQPMTLLAQTGVTDTLTQTIAIDAPSIYTWTAALDGQGTITPTLSAVSGAGSADLAVTLSSAGLLSGAYTNTLTISADDTVGGPVTVPLQVKVVDELWRVYLPAVLKP
ncbi:MAG: hypothetical protein R6X34_09100 [Chloroflexota bacterium]